MRNPRLLRSPLSSSSLNMDALNSALGITRISQVSVSQVLHATAGDISILNSHLRSWGVSSAFRSYPLLLRALTHPSISNWAERTLDVPKRSLGSKTLELLGDTVVGTSCAQRILTWLTTSTGAPHQGTDEVLRWTGSVRKLLPTLVGNRGMAHTARNIGIERLMRWEKSIPPSAHRRRVDELGVELLTGVQSNVEINALANAFEAVSAAVYLDGGFNPVLSFIDRTLLNDPAYIQRLNKDSAQMQNDLWQMVTMLFGEPVSFIKRLPVQQELQQQQQAQRRQHKERYQQNNRPNNTSNNFFLSSPSSSSYERIQLQLFDLQQKPSPKVSQAHVLFFAAVTIRQRPSSVSSSSSQGVLPPLDESQIIAMASHFSVENARIAAITRAMDILNGKCNVGPPRVVNDAAWVTDTITSREIQPLENNNYIATPSDGDVFQLETQFDRNGRWRYDGDYEHVGNALKQAGLKPLLDMYDDDHVRSDDVSTLMDDGDGSKSSTLASQVQCCLQSLRSQRDEDLSTSSYLQDHHDDELFQSLASFPSSSFDPSSTPHDGSQQQYSSSSSSPGSLPRREVNSCANVDVVAIQRCMDVGMELLSSSNATLHQAYPVLTQNVELDAARIAHALDTAVAKVDALERGDRVKYLVALQVLGHQTARLWAVQTAMSDVGQDIAQVVPQFESRVAQCGHVHHALMGDQDVLASVREGGLKKAYVAIGMCVDAVGLPTATAWLSGAEILQS